MRRLDRTVGIEDKGGAGTAANAGFQLLPLLRALLVRDFGVHELAHIKSPLVGTEGEHRVQEMLVEHVTAAVTLEHPACGEKVRRKLIYREIREIARDAYPYIDSQDGRSSNTPHLLTKSSELA